MSRYLKVILVELFALYSVLMIIVTSPVSAENERFYVGAAVCRQCHHQPGKHSQFNRWYSSKHAHAYAALAMPESMEIARLSGIDVNPFDSPVCLQCHTTASETEAWQRDEEFYLEDGIQCEACHGPGSEYSDATIMADREAALKAGLQLPGEDFCLVCHKPKGSHTAVLETRTFDYQTFLNEISHPGPGKETVLPDQDTPYVRVKLCARCHTGKNFNYKQTKKKIPHWVPGTLTAKTNTIIYKTPINLTLSPGGTRLFAACESSDSLIVVDTGKQTVLAEIKLQNQPHGVCLSNDSKRIFVSNRGSDTISVIDADSYKVLKHIPVGDEPHGLVTNVDDNILYVANAGSNDISVIDLKAGSEVKRLSAGRGAWAVNRSPDGQSVFITNNLSHFVKFRTPSMSEVTVIDTNRSVVKNRIMIPESNLVQGIDFSPDGEFALVTLLRTKNLIPITRVIQGWMITNGIGILWKDGRVDQLLLDETDYYFADPTDLVITPDGKYAYVSAGGIDAVAAIDLEKMKKILQDANENQRQKVLPNHLGISTEYVVKRIAVGRSPRGLAVSGDGRLVYAADGLDDTISVIDVAKQERIAVIDLGGPKEITLQRSGERIFHSAEITFGRQYSCHTCHPDGSVDGITYDIEPDGLGLNPVDNRTLRGILDTAPFKWTGKNPTLKRQCGPRLAVFFTRIDPFTPEQVIALERYICTIPRNPNRYRKGYELTAAQRRGKQLFERTQTNGGVEIPEGQRCIHCHSGPYFTNRRLTDVGTRSHLDTRGVFDVPHLNNIYETPPYLHDGRADTLEEIWTRLNPDDKHGVTNDMTKDQLNDLVEYLKTL
jgi:YVTN family beta-propeller protein